MIARLYGVDPLTARQIRSLSARFVENCSTIPMARPRSEDGEELKPYLIRRDAPGVAIVPLKGVISYDAGSAWDSFLAYMMGGTILQRFVQGVRAALDDPSVSAVMVDVHSPGGAAYGIPEAHETLMSWRGVKPMAAYCGGQACSAAYGLATAFEEFAVHASAQVGSVGTMLLMYDDRGMMEQMGLVEIPILADESPDKYPLPWEEEGYEQLLALVNATHAEFAAAISAGRGVSADEVNRGYGRGRVMTGREALGRGMVDRLDTFDGALRALARRAESGPPAGIRPAVSGLAMGPVVRSLPLGGVA